MECEMKYKLVFFDSHNDYETICQNLASYCHYNCPVEKLPCPFSQAKNCCDITSEDWKNVIKPEKE